MKVLVTGAAGRLGRHCVAELRKADYEVLATDRVSAATLDYPIKLVDLLDAAAVAPLCEGVQAVVHLGNHPGPSRGEKFRIFNENVAMNMNVFQAALEHGVRKIIFASSIQVIASAPVEEPFASRPPGPAYLPLDGDLPAQPANPYALSKRIGELMLRDYFVPAGIDAVAVRFPYMTEVAKLSQFVEQNMAEIQQTKLPPPIVRFAEGYGVLSFVDAARLIKTALAAPLPGYRVYLPAMSVLSSLPLAEVIQRYYPGVPLRRPVSELSDIFDLSTIERQTGWRPSPLPSLPLAQSI